MRKITIPHLVFSSLFFILSLFTILMLVLTSFAEEFRQMFRLTTQPFGVYFNITLVLIACGIMVSLFSLVRVFSSPIPKKYGFVILFALLGFVVFMYGELFMLNRDVLDPFSLKDSMRLQSEDVFYKTLYQILVDYGFFLLFFALPAIFYIFSLSFDKRSALGKILYLTQPSFNVMLGILFGFSIMPFLKGGIFGYIDFALFILGLIVVVFLCFKRKNYIDSYEVFDLFLLFVICVIMGISSFEFVSSESYFEVRKAFYALVLFGWCNAWMNKLKTLN